MGGSGHLDSTFRQYPMHTLDVLRFSAGQRPILDDESVRADTFLAEKIHASERRGRRVRIYQAESPTCRWSLRSLSVLLNELPIDWTDYCTFDRDRTAGYAIMQLFSGDGNGQGVNRIRIDISDDWIPSVQIIRPEINWGAW
jgi:hypothetical protein